LEALLKQQDLPEQPSLRVQENFNFFVEKLKSLGTDVSLVIKGLKKLLLVDISLSREQDNPQLIFESMNATGLELSQADLIRNYVLMGLKIDEQSELYENHWYPMERAFGQAAYGKHFDRFMRDYLTLKSGEIPVIRQVYTAFKSYAKQDEISARGVQALVADLQTYAGYYCAFALGKESEPRLAHAFSDLRDLKVDVANPLLLELYADYKSNLLNLEDLIEAVQLIESYVFRRAVCGIPTNSMNKTFAVFSRSLKKDRYLESIKANFLDLPSYRRFPNDSEFQDEVQVRDLYNFRSRSYWLRKVENFDKKEHVSVQEYTIEHILPQNKDLSKAWQESLGPNWKQIQEKYLHTLGNLTLTGYNPEYSDKPFSTKRDMEEFGFRYSPLRVNKGLGEIDTWNENSIRSRAEYLSNTAVRVWRSPKLMDEDLELIKRPKKKFVRTYSLADHKFLVPGSKVYDLFNALRENILALDPCVSEEILKYYIAYKAETNFVDVVPQSNTLSLTLNMQFHELHDFREIARDVTGLGLWGNGDVEVRLTHSEELPYIMTLIRQSLETQLVDEHIEN
ncbi:MAG: DUF1524 domain-containing protein, partial [Gammaproteobacteria bacterium]|nr:DUF1524 domain-containing protein [Gammaproteobacteria bacterium]